MFDKFWFPDGPELVELFNDGGDLNVNTFSLVAGQAYDVSIGWVFTE